MFLSSCQCRDQSGNFADSSKIARHLIIGDLAKAKFLVKCAISGFAHEIYRTRAILQEMPDERAADPLSLVFWIHGNGSQLPDLATMRLDLATAEDFILFIDGDDKPLPVQTQRVDPHYMD